MDKLSSMMEIWKSEKAAFTDNIMSDPEATQDSIDTVGNVSSRTPRPVVWRNITGIYSWTLSKIDDLSCHRRPRPPQCLDSELSPGRSVNIV